MTVKGLTTIGGATVLLLTAGAGLNGCATAPGSGDFAAPPVGTVLHFQRPKGAAPVGFRHKIVAASGDELVYHVTNETSEATNDQVRLYRGLFSYAYWRPGRGWVEYKFDRATLAPLWPLKVGNRVDFPVTFGFAAAKTEAEGKAKWTMTERGRMTFAVRRRERITVPAGTFDTFVIHRVRNFTLVAPPHRRIAVERVSWYAPSLGYVVRQTTQTMRVSRGGQLTPSGPVTVFELQKIDRPGSR